MLYASNVQCCIVLPVPQWYKCHQYKCTIWVICCILWYVSYHEIYCAIVMIGNFPILHTTNNLSMHASFLLVSGSFQWWDIRIYQYPYKANIYQHFVSYLLDISEGCVEWFGHWVRFMLNKKPRLIICIKPSYNVFWWYKILNHYKYRILATEWLWATSKMVMYSSGIWNSNASTFTLAQPMPHSGLDYLNRILIDTTYNTQQPWYYFWWPA